MDTSSSPAPTHPQPRRDDRGTVMVEFAMVSVLFVSLIFGIISMGVLLSFKQNLTQAASEAARSAVSVYEDGTGDDDRYTVVDTALAAVVSEFDQSCNVGGVSCARVIHDCDDDTTNYSAAGGGIGSGLTEDTATSDACLTVRIEFDNTGSNRILPAMPFISELEPDTMASQTTVRLVPVA